MGRGRVRRRLGRLGLLAALLALALGGVEGVLRLLPGTRDRGRFFARAGDGQWTFAPANTGTRFAERKPAGTLRIMCFGGSVMEGGAYGPISTFPNYLRAMLAAAAPAGRVEVINCGRAGFTSADAREALAAATRFAPDLVVIYCGEHEPGRPPLPARIGRRLARSTRLGAILGRRWLPESAGQGPFIVPTRDESGRGRESGREYLANVEAMIAAARAGGAKAIVGLPAGNLRDWPALASRYPAGMAPARRRELATQVRQAEDELAAGRKDEARALLDAVLASAPDHARAHFFRGRIALAGGEPAAARAEFVRARDEDVSGVDRPRSDHDAALRELAARTGADVVEFQAVFDQAGLDGIAGFELLDDASHPNVDGQVTIAARLAAAVADAEPGRFALPSAAELAGRKPEWLAAAGVTDDYLAGRTRATAFYLGFALEDRLINDEAARRLEAMPASAPGSPLPGIAAGLIRLRQGRIDEGRADLAGALAADPGRFGLAGAGYFHRSLRWESPYLWTRAAPGTDFLPLWRDYLAAPAAGQGPGQGLADADHVFRWEPEGRELVDVTTAVAEKLEQQGHFALSESLPITIYDPDHIKALAAAERVMPSEDGGFIATGPDPLLVFAGTGFDPVRYTRLTVRGAFAEAGEPITGGLCVYWKDQDHGGFSEERKSCQPLRVNGPSADYRFDFSDDPGWLLASPVTALRLDPGEGKIKFRIEKIIIRAAPKLGSRKGEP
jgi:lysophospholipase L1-like esterase